MEPAGSHRDTPETASTDAALRDLDRLRHEGDVLSGMLRQSAAHLSPADVDAIDPVERWGRRIGRGLAVVAFLGFCVYFFASHVR